MQLYVHLKKLTLKFKLLYLRNYISYFNKIYRICCVNTRIQSLNVWLRSVLPRLKYSIFSRGLFFIGTPCLSTGVIPHQCKSASIGPVPKISSPVSLLDYRPISITPALSRVMEHIVVSKFIYPVLLMPSPSLVFSDQYAFRLSGSTTSAVIAIFQTVTNLLSNHLYVMIISLR